MIGRIATRRFGLGIESVSRIPAVTSTTNKIICISQASTKVPAPGSSVLLQQRQISTTKWWRDLATDDPLHKRISDLIGSEKVPVVIFMKGVPEAPRCGFSNAVCQILRMHEVPFESHDVLADEELRQGIKDFSNWPTIPQVYFKGEFIGGCDILLQMHQSGELVEELQNIGVKSALLTASENETTKKDDK